jgi:hypothetical protein
VFARSFKREVRFRKPSPTMSSADGPSVSEALAMAAKAGQVVSGFSKVEGAIEGRQAAALIHATDGAADGIRKLNAKLTPQGGKTPGIGRFSGDQRPHHR